MLKAMKGNDNMRYGIICAMDEELKDLLENLEDRTDKEVGGTEFYTGKIKGKEVVLVRCGIGKVQSGITTALMIVEFNVDCVINSGSAGGIGNGRMLATLFCQPVPRTMTLMRLRSDIKRDSFRASRKFLKPIRNLFQDLRKHQKQI